MGRFFEEWVVPRWRSILLSLTVAVGLGIATSGYPIIIKHAFDTIGQGKMEHLWIVLTAIVGITAFRGLCLYLHQIVSNAVILRLTADLQRRTFAHLINADYARFARESTGHMVTRQTHDIALIAGAGQTTLNTLLRDLISVITLIATMFYLDPVLSLIIIGVFPFTVLPILLVSRRLRRMAKRMAHEVGDMTSSLTERLSGARLIKTFRLESHAEAKLNSHFEQLYVLRMKAVRARARLGPVLEAFAGIAIAGVIALATWRIASGISSTGDFMAFVTALLLAAQSLRSVGNFTTGVQDGIAAVERLYELLDEKPKVVDRPGAKALTVSKGDISFDRVSFAYENRTDTEAVSNVSIEVPGGKTVALVGRSGAGKSTIVNLVPRLFDVTGGAIRIDGQDVRDVTLASLRDRIAIVSQEITLFDDTIAANIALGRLGASHEDIVAAATAAAAHDFIMAQPQGYATMIGDGGLRLSGGQRQRLVLARAILKDAPILLLDEATSALDAESERLVQQALQRFTKGRTTLVIAHRLATVQRADIIVVLDNGGVAEMGTHSALLQQDGIYAALCRTQMLAEAQPASLSIN
ncbi:MAG: Lipid export ATP-binding/permease protein MsbA [Pseudomonadota bacterium]|jgi:subfamily B ATP-binding cassette protein MsbA